MSTRITACALRINADNFFSQLEVSAGKQQALAAKVARGTMKHPAWNRDVWAEMVDGRPVRLEHCNYFNYMQSGPWLVLFAWDHGEVGVEFLEKLTGCLGVDGFFFCMNDQVGWEELGVFNSGQQVWKYIYSDGEVLAMDGVSPESLLKNRQMLRADKRDATITFEAYEATSDEEGEQQSAFYEALCNALPIDLFELGCDVDEDALGACRICFQDQISNIAPLIVESPKPNDALPKELNGKHQSDGQEPDIVRIAMRTPDRFAPSQEKDALLLGIANGTHGMVNLYKAFDDQEDALRYYALHIQRVAVSDTRFCTACSQPAEMRYKAQWKAVVDHHATRNIAMTLLWTLLAMVPFFKWFVKHQDWLEEAREMTFTCEQPVCVTCADGADRRMLPALGLRALFWLLKTAAVVALVCAVAMVFILWKSRSMEDKLDFKMAWLWLGSSVAVLVVCQLFGPSLCALVEFPAFARKLGRRPFMLQSGKAEGASKPKNVANRSSQDKVFHFDADPAAESNSRRKGVILTVLLAVGILAGIVGGGVWVYRKSAASLEARAEQKNAEENAFRRRMRAAHAANEAAAREADPVVVPK